MDERDKNLLIKALEEEQEMFRERDQSVLDHHLTITYLKTGTYPKDYNKFEILTAAIEDYDTLYKDYVTG